MKKLIRLLVPLLVGTPIMGCSLKDDCPNCHKHACTLSADCEAASVCLDGSCVILKDYCLQYGGCGNILTDDSTCKCDCACPPAKDCPACNPPACPEIPPYPDCPACNPALSCPLPVCPAAVCPPAPACNPQLSCPPAPACNPNLSCPACPKCPDLVYNECPDKPCVCAGGLTSLTLRNDGYSATITVIQSDGQTVFQGYVAHGGSFTFSGKAANGTFGATISVHCNPTVIDTSCTTPIKIGDQFGSYVVLDGASLTNGKLCPAGSADGGTSP